MKKGFLMLRGILLAITLLLTLSACASATPTPSPSPEISSTPTATRTISPEELTALATYRPTLAPSFTPVTPSITPIPSITPTPTNRPTATPIPIEQLCPQFTYGPYAPEGTIIGVDFNVPNNFSIKLDLYSAETDQYITGTVREGDLTLVFDPARMPAMEYRWVVSLEDESRTGLCPIEGLFNLPELNPEVTAESTEALVPTATATARIRSTEETGR
jgi:hypothetical protein